jgi:NDP-sugar pyrophosphorylase family protein
VLSGLARFPLVDRAGMSGDGVLLGREVRRGTGVKLGPEVAVGDGCILGDGAAVARSVLWNGTKVGPGETLDGCILAGPHRLQL